MIKYYCYIARCNDQSLSVGSTNNIQNREAKHNKGLGAKYTSTRLPVKIIYYETFESRAEAMKRERQIKSWSKNKKESLIKYGRPNELKAVNLLREDKFKIKKSNITNY